MTLSPLAGTLLGAALVLAATAVIAEDVDPQGDANVRQISTHMGEMFGEIPMRGTAEDSPDTLRFEPWQMIGEMFTRSDLVFLMRHGPTDWSKLDIKDVAPTDCANQRVLSAEGAADMQNLGNLLATNGVAPGRIVVSEWCRNQQTLENLKIGFSEVDPDYANSVPVETNPDLNLLLSLQGAPDVVGLRELISNWDGGDQTGPLLVVSHFTNIEELTNFSVFEGEVLVVDPKRENRVLGYLRLRSAAPDVGHFDVAVDAGPAN